MRRRKERNELSESGKEENRTKDKQRKTSKRCAATSSLEKSIETFTNLVKVGPEFFCCCCHRLMYKEYTSLLDETKYDKLDSDVKAAWISAMSSNDSQRYICNTCHWHMKRNRMPPQAAANNLQVPEIPEELQDWCIHRSCSIQYRRLYPTCNISIQSKTGIQIC